MYLVFGRNRCWLHWFIWIWLWRNAWIWSIMCVCGHVTAWVFQSSVSVSHIDAVNLTSSYWKQCSSSGKVGVTRAHYKRESEESCGSEGPDRRLLTDSAVKDEHPPDENSAAGYLKLHSQSLCSEQQTSTHNICVSERILTGETTTGR